MLPPARTRRFAAILDRHRLRIKPVDAAPPGQRLQRVLGRWDLVALGIGAIIGAGVFVLTGIVAATEAGPGVILSFLVAGLACGLSALAYAELAAAVGGCGSAYGYAYAALGELAAWIIGWALILEYGMSVSAVAVGWSGYFENVLRAAGVNLPPALLSAPDSGGLMNLPAMTIIAVLGGLLIYDVRSSSRINAAIVLIKLLAIGVFLIVGAGHIEPANWQPLLPYGWSGVMQGAALIFFAYIGFDAVSTAAEEARDPARDLPFGIIVSLALCTAVYILVAGVLTGIAPYPALNVPSPVSSTLLALGEDWAAGVVAGGAIAGLTSVMLVVLYGQSRILLAMARDGLLPPLLSDVHAERGTPIPTLVMTVTVTALVAGFLPIRAIAELVNIGTLAAFTVVCAGVIALRIAQPQLPRPFRTPYSPLIPALGVLACIYLMLNLPRATWLAFALWMGMGLVLYAFYGYRHSRLARGGNAG